MSSSSLVFMIAWSMPDPASMHTIIRSSASGRPLRICFCRAAVLRPSHRLGRTNPSAAPSSAKYQRLNPNVARAIPPTTNGRSISAAA